MKTTSVETQVIGGDTYLVDIAAEWGPLATSDDVNNASVSMSVTGGTFTKVIAIPGHGFNSAGKVVQNIILRGIWTPANDNAPITVSLKSLKVTKLGQPRQIKLVNATGAIQLTKINLTTLASGPTAGPIGNLKPATAVAAKASVAKKVTTAKKVAVAAKKVTVAKKVTKK